MRDHSISVDQARYATYIVAKYLNTETVNTSTKFYYADIKDVPLSDLLIHNSIKTENKLMAFSDSIWQDFTENGINTEAYIIFYQGGPIDHGAHVPE